MYVVRESTWICKVGSCLTNLVTFFREANKLVDKGIMADITYSVYNLPKAFKELKKSEDKRKLGISGQFSQKKEVTSEISVGFVLGPAMFPILINGLEMRGGKS